MRGKPAEGGAIHPCGLEKLAELILVTAGPNGSGRVVQQPERLAGHCSGKGGFVADWNDGVEQMLGGVLDDHFCRGGGLFKSQRDSAIPPGVFQYVAAVAARHGGDAELIGSLLESGGLIARGGEQQ